MQRKVGLARLPDNRGNSTCAFLRRSAWRAVDSLFRRFAVEVLVVGPRLGAGMVDNAISMIWRRIERIELQWNTAGIDDVVIRPGRNDYREARPDRRPNAIENRLRDRNFDFRDSGAEGWGWAQTARNGLGGGAAAVPPPR